MFAAKKILVVIVFGLMIEGCPEKVFYTFRVNRLCDPDRITVEFSSEAQQAQCRRLTIFSSL